MTPSLPPPPSCVCLSLLPSISFIHSAHCFFHHPVGKSSPVFLHGFSCHGIIISTVLSRGKKIRDALCWFEDLLLNLSCNAYKYDSWTENPGLTFVVMLQLVTFSGFPSISDSKRSTSTILSHTHTHIARKHADSSVPSLPRPAAWIRSICVALVRFGFVVNLRSFLFFRLGQYDLPSEEAIPPFTLSSLALIYNIPN